MKKIIFCLILITVAGGVIAQEPERPAWTNKPPKAGNSTYVYVVQHAGGKTPAEARNNALAEVYRQAIMRIGVAVDWTEISNSLQNETVDWGAISAKYKLPVNKICEYIETSTNGYVMFVLCQVARSGNVYPEFEEFRGCNDKKSYSNAVSLVESMFIPGLGQMTKNRGGHGTGVLLGELVFVGGGVTSWYFAKQELDRMNDPNISLDDFKKAKKNYKTFRIANIAAYSAAAALYVGNLFQAYFIKPKYKGNKRMLSFYPSIIPTEEDMAAGVGLTYNF